MSNFSLGGDFFTGGRALYHIFTYNGFMILFSMHKVKTLFSALLITFLAGIFLVPATPYAQSAEQWLFYQTDKRILTTRIPYGYKVKTQSFISGENKTLNYEEIVGRFGNSSSSKAPKIYAVKYEQVLGIPVSQEDAERLILRDLGRIRKSYEPLNGEVVSDKMATLGPYKYAEIIMEYDDEILGRQSNRTRVLFTPKTKFTLTVLGAPGVMTSLHTRDFFEKFEFWDHVENTEKSLPEEWRTIEAPHKTFSVLVPKPSEIYFKQEPKIQKAANSDSINMVFTDPVREENLFYNVYTYYSPQNATFQSVKQLLRTRHINNRQKKRREVPFIEEIVDNRAFIQSAYNIQAPGKFPYAQIAKLRVQFNNNYIIVQELIGSNNLITSDFANTLLSKIIFHPEDSLLGQ